MVPLAGCAEHTITVDGAVNPCANSEPLPLDVEVRCGAVVTGGEIGGVAADCVLGDHSVDDTDNTLRIVSGSLRIQNLADIELTKLQFVGGCIIIESAAASGVSLPALTDTRGIVVVTRGLRALSAPELANGDVIVRGSSLLALRLPRHEVGVIDVDGATLLGAIETQALAGGLRVQHAPALLTISAPALTTVSALRIEDTSVQDVDVGALVAADELVFADNAQLRTVAIANLTRVRSLVRVENNGAAGRGAVCAAVRGLTRGPPSEAMIANDCDPGRCSDGTRCIRDDECVEDLCLR